VSYRASSSVTDNSKLQAYAWRSKAQKKITRKRLLAVVKILILITALAPGLTILERLGCMHTGLARGLRVRLMLGRRGRRLCVMLADGHAVHAQRPSAARRAESVALRVQTVNTALRSGFWAGSRQASFLMREIA
jgi:hypothetical protein